MKRFFQVLPRIIIVIVALLLASAAGAPYLLTSTVLPRLLAGQGLTEIAVEISQISPWRLSGTITLGQGQRPGGILPFRLNYRLPELLSGHLSALSVTGAIIRVHLEKGTLRIAGFTPPSPDGTESKEGPLLPALPLTIDTISVTDSQLHLTDPAGRLHTLSVNARVEIESFTTAAGRYLPKAAAGQFDLAGAVTASADFRLGQEDSQTQLAVRGRGRSIAALYQVLPSGTLPAIQGAVEFDGKLRMDSWQITEAKGTLRFPGLEIRHDTFALAGDGTIAPSLSIEGTREQLQFTLTNLAASAPYPASLQLNGSFSPASGQLDARAVITSSIFSQPLATGLTGTLSPKACDLLLTVAGDSQQVLLNGLQLRLGQYRLDGQLQMTGVSPAVTITARTDSLQLPDHTLELRDITGQIHHTFAPAASASPGAMAVGAIRYRGEDLGQASASLTTTAAGLDFSGQVGSRRNRNLQLRFSGNADADGTLNLDFTIPPANITQATLPRFAGLPKELSFSGRIQGSATLARAAGTMRGAATLKLSDGLLEYDDKTTQLAGITTELNLPFLPRVTSATSQQLRIATLNLGNLKLSDGLIHFRIEDGQNLFIEKSRFNWCGGKVESGSLRVSLSNPELATTLYCDRLQFTELLSQLGIPGAEGDGSLNGRLPLVYTGKELVFDDGFLFSTPGNSGIVRFTNTAMLRQGLPEASQTAYLDYSMQAMENFSYNWTKLTFNSQGDELRIVMQIDGKPAAPLPFGYRNGQLVEQPAGGGIQHPVRLDVNFNLPFTRMFTFGQSLQKKMKR